MVCEINGRKFFSEVLQKNIDKQLDRVQNQYASCILVDGGVGKSKTCTDRQIADYICLKKASPLIENKELIARGGKELFEKAPIWIKNGYPVGVYDEAGDFSKKRVLTDFNLAISRFFEQYRQFGIVLIVSLPLMDVLDRSILDLEVVRFLIHIEARHDTENDCKVYSLHRIFYLKGRMKGLEQKSFAYKIIKCNFKCHINRLPFAIEEQLKAFSLQGKKKELQAANILANQLVSYSDIANKLHKSMAWVRAAIKNNHIKVKQKIARQNYYSKEVIDILADYQLSYKN